MEADASIVGICAILTKEGRPIEIFRKKLGAPCQKLSTCEQELYAMVRAVKKMVALLIS